MKNKTINRLQDYFLATGLIGELEYNERFFKEFIDNKKTIDTGSIKKYLGRYCSMLPNFLGFAGIVASTISKNMEFMAYCLAIGEGVRFGARSSVSEIFEETRLSRKNILEKITQDDYVSKTFNNSEESK